MMKFSQHGEIEDAVLSTFLFAQDYDMNIDEAFTLDLTAFTNRYRQSVAQAINNVKSYQYSFLFTQLEEKAVGTVNELDFMNIIAQTQLSFPVAQRYHDELVKRNKMKGAI